MAMRRASGVGRRAVGGGLLRVSSLAAAAAATTPTIAVAITATTADAAAAARILGAKHGDLHAATEGADVADDDAIAVVQTGENLGLAGALVDDAELHVGDVDLTAGDAIDEGAPILLRLTQRRRGY